MLTRLVANLVSVIGGGLAGCELALQLARRRVPVHLLPWAAQVRAGA